MGLGQDMTIQHKRLSPEQKQRHNVYTL